ISQSSTPNVPSPSPSPNAAADSAFRKSQSSNFRFQTGPGYNHAMTDWTSHVEKIGQSARAASRKLANLTGAQKCAVLSQIASALRQDSARLLEANSKDISAARDANLAPPLIERLKLNENKIEQMALAVEQIAAQVDPVGQIIEGYIRPNGLR